VSDAGLVAPNFLCAKLLYKILSYRFAGGHRGAPLMPAG